MPELPEVFVGFYSNLQHGAFGGALYYTAYSKEDEPVLVTLVVAATPEEIEAGVSTRTGRDLCGWEDLQPVGLVTHVQLRVCSCNICARRSKQILERSGVYGYTRGLTWSR